MKPTSITWTYQRIDRDLETNSYNGIATRMDYSEKEININTLIPKDCDNYMLYLVIIFKLEHSAIIMSCIKTKESIFEDDNIPSNSYYGYYLVPSNYDIVTNNLRITDTINNDLFIEINCINVLNKTHLNYLKLPESVIYFN